MTKRTCIIDRIAELAGQDAADQIYAEFRGQSIYIKIDRAPQPHDLPGEIFAAFTGDNHNELAERFNTSAQHVYRVVKVAQALAAEPAKRAALDGLIDVLVNSASMLALDDIHYLTVQVTLAWQHPVALLSRLQQIGATDASLPDGQPAGAVPAPEPSHPAAAPAPPDAAQPPQSGASPGCQPPAPSAPDDLS